MLPSGYVTSLLPSLNPVVLGRDFVLPVLVLSAMIRTVEFPRPCVKCAWQLVASSMPAQFEK